MAGLLKGQVAVITGAGKGIGAAIAMRMADEGANIVVIDIDFENANKVSKKIESLNVRSRAIQLDITDTKKISNIVDLIVREFGKIDIWVNNAGISKAIPIEQLTEKDWDSMLNLNLKAVFFCSQAVFTIMKKQRYGRIINISSMAGEKGGQFTGANYVASKAGVLGLTKVFALNGGEYNITANAITPGLIDTDMAVDLGFTKSGNTVPMKRLGSAYEVAGAAVFLASELSDYVSGHTIDVNGALYIR
ncbi:SDR family NAD(P)-dependent oxidoreductase [Clostridium sp. HV4-5-A1G]|uniref:SDR family NAD(P)-dependent oxidoreductase n=1 Tax=Clostridium sp. HV4-5-A1G TaxID=2004595 RepID=UPI00123BFAA4|nr:SDR family NAD(P)-dependent oxidoreductase [Clostridium sp. HV4-5-A1G]KAA8679076.1 SDR family oxidoreductase [Clostridium sp. HV4-5-A1G]